MHCFQVLISQQHSVLETVINENYRLNIFKFALSALSMFYKRIPLSKDMLVCESACVVCWGGIHNSYLS